MKARLLLLLLLVVTVDTLKAQSYIPFPATNTTWREQFRRSLPDPYTIHNYGLKNSDTVINGTAYHKLYKSADTIFDESEVIGGIREDTQKRVYYRLREMTGGLENDKLIYDFSLQVGDTLHSSDNNGNNNWMVTMYVTQVDSININGTYHRRIIFDWPKTTWVEGFGNGVRGLLFFSGTWPNNGQWNDLICFGQNGNWIFHNTTSAASPNLPLPGCDENLVGIRDHFIPSEDIIFHPVPVVDISQVYLKTHEKLNRMDIYDIAGKKIKTYAGNATGRISINRNDYAPGIYSYRLYTAKGENASGKFVVQ